MASRWMSSLSESSSQLGMALSHARLSGRSHAHQAHQPTAEMHSHIKGQKEKRRKAASVDNSQLTRIPRHRQKRTSNQSSHMLRICYTSRNNDNASDQGDVRSLVRPSHLSNWVFDQHSRLRRVKCDLRDGKTECTNCLKRHLKSVQWELQSGTDLVDAPGWLQQRSASREEGMSSIMSSASDPSHRRAPLRPQARIWHGFLQPSPNSDRNLDHDQLAHPHVPE